MSVDLMTPMFRCTLVKEGNRQYSAGNMVDSPEKGYRLVKDYMETLDREELVVALLDTKHRLIGFNVVSVGTIDASLVAPVNVFKPAILANAATILLAHNHPSGDASPSPQDLQITRRLIEAGRILDLEILDHIVVGDGYHVSIRERVPEYWS